MATLCTGDVDHDHAVSLTELKQALSCLGIEYTEEHVQLLFENIGAWIAARELHESSTDDARAHTRVEKCERDRTQTDHVNPDPEACAEETVCRCPYVARRRGWEWCD